MYDYGFSTLEQYSLTVLSTARTRGALLCRCEEGLFILKEFKGTEKKLKKQQELLEGLSAAAAGLTAIFRIKKEIWSAGTVIIFHTHCSSGMREGSAIPGRRRISCGACGLWHRCINI